MQEFRLACALTMTLDLRPWAKSHWSVGLAAIKLIFYYFEKLIFSGPCTAGGGGAPKGNGRGLPTEAIKT